ncbi:T9SS type B sorting domain-containing protein [Pareuzebyella sediminis]|uniref:T9SS type B sorting domain-containing protein n=1 Tax=Pareuzebyella sediminis TaxID=2607998 RepID=UPI0011ED1AE0|nr:T9SS type B sorting domain-containing protein [Pareuzebyella sediminis]
MKKEAIIFFWVLLIPLFISGQGETSNWYFGSGAGLRFNNDGSVTPLSNGQLRTLEGCATISDPFGNLLFYTDGITVYNARHQRMENGNGLFGNDSSSQSAIIVPDPGNENGYYIFTVDTSFGEFDESSGFNYSYVNLMLADGLGAVTKKNVNLLPRCSEKISAVVKDCDESSFWVITSAPANANSEIYNNIFSYEINGEGIQEPVKSVIPQLYAEDKRGYLKLSPNGAKVAMATAESGLFLLDFNPTTGTVSNPLRLFMNRQNFAPYGVEFSPNNRFLYVHSSNDTMEEPHSSALFQFDLQSTDINESRRTLDQRSIYRGALQLGQNGKIYRALANSYQAGTNFLGVIENPNDPQAEYVHNAIELGPGTRSTQGLPPFVQSFFDKVNIIGSKGENRTNSGTLPLCVGESYTLEAPEFANGTYVWYKDNEKLANSTSSLELANTTIADSGTYKLVIEGVGYGRCPVQGEAKVIVEPIPEPEDTELVQCDIDENPEDGLAIFNLNNALSGLTGPGSDFSLTFFTSEQNVLDNVPIANPEKYQNIRAGEEIWVSVRNKAGCGDLAKITLQTVPVAIEQATVPNFYGCDEDPQDAILAGFFDFDELALRYTGMEASFYSDLEDLAQGENALVDPEVFEEGTVIYVKLANNGQCAAVEYVTLLIDPKPQVEPPSDIPILCLNNPSITLIGPEGYDEYQWLRETDNGTYEVVSEGMVANLSNGGSHILQVTEFYEDQQGTRSCSNTAIFTVPVSNVAIFQPEPEVRDLSQNNIITVFTFGEGDYEFSLNPEGPYQSDNFFENVPSGFVTVYARDKNGCGLSETEVAVVGHDKFFTPNNDGVNDFWQINGINKLVQPGSLITIFNRYGKLLAQLRPEERGWDGTFKGIPVPSSDYWFRVELQDGRMFKGHFTLKR